MAQATAKTIDQVFTFLKSTDDTRAIITHWSTLNHIKLEYVNSTTPIDGSPIALPSHEPLMIRGKKMYHRPDQSPLRSFIKDSLFAIIIILLIDLFFSGIRGTWPTDVTTNAIAACVAVFGVFVIGRLARKGANVVNFQFTLSPHPLDRDVTSVRVWASSAAQDVHPTISSLAAMLN